jgi:hypothetical protein
MDRLPVMSIPNRIRRRALRERLVGRRMPPRPKETEAA